MKQKNYLTSLILLSATVALVGCSATRYSRSTGEYIDDKTTYGRVKTALAKDSLVKASDIQVSSFRGNVQVTGFVDDLAQKERASQLVGNIKGVNWFRNDIIVKDQLPRESQRIYGEQMNEPAGASRDYNYNQRQPSSRIAGSASGASVRSDSGWQKGSVNVSHPSADISVRAGSDVSASGSGISAGASVGSAGISSEASFRNNDLAQRIQTQLRTDNARVAQQIRVESATNGKVTLRGVVGSEIEKQLIETKVKKMSGVYGVENKLEVRNQ